MEGFARQLIGLVLVLVGLTSLVVLGLHHIERRLREVHQELLDIERLMNEAIGDAKKRPISTVRQGSR